MHCIVWEMNVTYSFIEFRNLDIDTLGLLVSLQLEQPRFLFDNLTKEIRQKLLVVPRLSEVFSEPLQNKHSISSSYHQRH